jgi:hypothetical protein
VNKEYKIKPNKEQLKIMKAYWEKLQQIEAEFSEQVAELEESLSHDINIEGIEFFSCDGSYVGIGNAERTMKLILLR